MITRAWEDKLPYPRRLHAGTATAFAEVARLEIGMPISCPCSLQRIPDLRTRSPPL